jgi:hypothetical protein
MTDWPEFRRKYWTRTPQGERHKLKAWYTEYRKRNARTYRDMLETILPHWLLAEEMAQRSFFNHIKEAAATWGYSGQKIVVPFNARGCR